MEKTYRLKIELEPHPKARPRFAVMRGVHAGRVMTYTHENDKAAEKAYHFEIMRQGGIEYISGPVYLSARFVFERPRSHFRTGKYSNLLKSGAPMFHTSKPDKDNLEKFLYDILNSYWEDDKNVYRSDTLKAWAGYGEVAHTEIMIIAW